MANREDLSRPSLASGRQKSLVQQHIARYESLALGAATTSTRPTTLPDLLTAIRIKGRAAHSLREEEFPHLKRSLLTKENHPLLKHAGLQLSSTSIQRSDERTSTTPVPNILELPEEELVIYNDTSQLSPNTSFFIDHYDGENCNLPPFQAYSDNKINSQISVDKPKYSSSTGFRPTFHENNTFYLDNYAARFNENYPSCSRHSSQSFGSPQDLRHETDKFIDFLQVITDFGKTASSQVVSTTPVTTINSASDSHTDVQISRLKKDAQPDDRKGPTETRKNTPLSSHSGDTKLTEASKNSRNETPTKKKQVTWFFPEDKPQRNDKEILTNPVAVESFGRKIPPKVAASLTNSDCRVNHGTSSLPSHFPEVYREVSAKWKASVNTPGGIGCKYESESNFIRGEASHKSNGSTSNSTPSSDVLLGAADKLSQDQYTNPDSTPNERCSSARSILQIEADKVEKFKNLNKNKVTFHGDCNRDVIKSRHSGGEKTPKSLSERLYDPYKSPFLLKEHLISKSGGMGKFKCLLARPPTTRL